MAENLLQVLEHGASGAPALVVPEGPALDYGRLRSLVAEGSEALASFGIGPGDRVAMVYPNGAEAIVLFLATAAVATACPLNSAYKEDEFRFYLEDTGARALLVPPGGGEEARRALPRGAIVIEAAIEPDGRLRIESSAPRDGAAAAVAGPDDVALVLHTSGTTSRPKRVPLRHRHLLASIEHIAAHYRLGPEDVSLTIMPLFHIHGLVASTLSTFRTGGTVVAPTRFNPLGFWPLVAAQRPTWWSASPAPQSMALARVKNAERPAGLDRLRFVRSCSSALPPAMMAEMEARYGVPVLEAYGMTEASHQMASNPLPPEPRLPGTVGRGTGVRVGIMDDSGGLLRAGAQGEVVIQGPNVIDGYENNPEANAASFTDGWFRTGDRGSLDAAGYLTLVGRIKELINRGGEKIAPVEIDQVLEAHPLVREAVVFGVPHPTWGEEVAAAVVADGPVTPRELQAWCRERLSDFKVPKVVHVVDAIPRTATGKIQRRHVAAAFTTG